MDESPDKTVTFYITNAHAHPVTFNIEPWGEYYELERHHTLTVVAIGPDVQPEIVSGDTDIYYWASPGSTVKVFREHSDIDISGVPGSERTRTPLLPTKPLRAILGKP